MDASHSTFKAATHVFHRHLEWPMVFCVTHFSGNDLFATAPRLPEDFDQDEGLADLMAQSSSFLSFLALLAEAAVGSIETQGTDASVVRASERRHRSIPTHPSTNPFKRRRPRPRISMMNASLRMFGRQSLGNAKKHVPPNTAHSFLSAEAYS
mmetsp:Transcript_6694/g.9790  ORF Transcript_6694/g.9790 Transcript_6694/m.9790 type:complete len:153 (-) Transcript_6694:257-715(-)